MGKKVILNGNVIMDVTDTTAVASDVAQGKYFYNANGIKTEGTNQGGSANPYAEVLNNQSSSTKGQYLFYGASNIDNTNIGTYLTSEMQQEITKVDGLFSGTQISNANFGDIVLGSSPTVGRTNNTLNQVFLGCSNLTSVNWGHLFDNVGQIDTSHWNRIGSTDEMFSNCSGLETIDLTNVPFSSLANSTYTTRKLMFNTCSNLISVGLPRMMCSDTEGMFQGCQVLTTLDISNLVFDPSGANAKNMFNNCRLLNTLIIDVTSFKNIINKYHIFFNCYALSTIHAESGSSTDWEDIDGFATIFDGMNIRTNQITVYVSDGQYDYTTADRGRTWTYTFTQSSSGQESYSLQDGTYTEKADSGIYYIVDAKNETATNQKGETLSISYNGNNQVSIGTDLYTMTSDTYFYDSNYAFELK